MANLNTQKMTDVTAVPSVMLKAAEAHGRMRVWYESYTASSVSVDDTITFARLPKGATVYNVRITTAALGSGVTLQVGDSGDDNRYIVATSAASAAVINTTAASISTMPYTLTEQTDLFIQVKGNPASGVIKVMVEYSLGD